MQALFFYGCAVNMTLAELKTRVLSTKGKSDRLGSKTREMRLADLNVPQVCRDWGMRD